MSDLRVLLPERFDVLSRAMDTNLVDQWFFLREACELIPWGPGLPGFDPALELDAVAELTGADIVLLPDLHHGIPGLWDDLWRGAERVACPVVWHLTDFGSALDQRRAVLERIRPDAVLLNSPEALLSDYQDLFDAHGIRRLVVSWGFDAIQFSAEPATERTIDLLICGCDEPEWVYPVRRKIKAAARTLTERVIVDLEHPGYWEVHGSAAGRGQAGFADLLRRSKLVTTGSAFASLPRKYWESASCGAVGVGDLPPRDPDVDRFRGCSLEIDPEWPVERIAEELRQLLDNPQRLAQLSGAGPAAVAACDHRLRAHEYVAAFRSLMHDRPLTRPATPPTLPDALRVAAAVDPSAVPATRADWRDIWRSEVPGGSRGIRLEQHLTSNADELCVIALDPDAARHVDAAMVVCEAAATGQVVVRSVASDEHQTLLDHPWALVAAPRAALLTALRAQPAWYGVEAAVLTLAADIGARVLPGGSVIDLAGHLAWLVAAGEGQSLTPEQYRERLVALAERAEREQRPLVAAEALGRAATLGGDPSLGVRTAYEHCGPPCPPALQEPLGDEAFLIFDPQRPESVAAIAGYAARGPSVKPLAIGIGMWSGLSVQLAFSLLADRLYEAGVNLDFSAEMRLLERPLWAVEVAWLTAFAGPLPDVQDWRATA